MTPPHGQAEGTCEEKAQTYFPGKVTQEWGLGLFQESGRGMTSYSLSCVIHIDSSRPS